MSWDYQGFGRWLRTARVSNLPVMSQERVAEIVGVTQAKMSRWEMERPRTEPPNLEQCRRLAELFDGDLIELAEMCGQWNPELERSLLVALAGGPSPRPPAREIATPRERISLVGRSALMGRSTHFLAAPPVAA